MPVIMFVGQLLLIMSRRWTEAVNAEAGLRKKPPVAPKDHRAPLRKNTSQIGNVLTA